jgi:serine/threonine-protein kinase HipA
MTNASVKLWGTQVGAVSWDEARRYGVFQYAPEIVGSGIEIAPLIMPTRALPYSFPALSRETFKGLPGLLADSLPDKYGNQLIDTWLARQGRSPASFNPVERLCYIGTRGIGALEFEPAATGAIRGSSSVDIAELVTLANRILDERNQFSGKLSGKAEDMHALEHILRVGTSAGGARAKAVLSWNESTGEFRSGQVGADPGFAHWLLKFDGVSKNADKELADPQGFGRIEFAYHKMAVAAGIEMTRCRLHVENGRAHFMTRRFDRPDGGDKLHMQSLTAMMHYDFNVAGAYSYEQAVQVLKQLDAGRHDVEQQVMRALFNVVGRNQDDHPKNIAYLMDRAGKWRLSPAFDIAYAYNPSGSWTDRHQMSLNGKRDAFSREDLVAFGKAADLKLVRVNELLDAVIEAVAKWPDFAAEAGVSDAHINSVAAGLRHKALK